MHLLFSLLLLCYGTQAIVSLFVKNKYCAEFAIADDDNKNVDDDNKYVDDDNDDDNNDDNDNNRGLR